MKNFLRRLTKNNIEKKGERKSFRVYSSSDYEYIRDSIGMFVILKLLKEIDTEVHEQK